MVSNAKIEVCADKDALATRVADWLVERCNETTGTFALNLSGGSTPKAIYALLATESYRRKLDWSRVQIFFGDERFVPHDHPDSNFKMADDALLSKVPLPTGSVHAVPADGHPADAAASYARTLQSFYGAEALDPGRPLFAVTLLGLGDDGHTASLFPGTTTLEERDAWVTSIVGAKPEPRITMTYPVLESSGAVAFLVAGAGKRVMLNRLLDGDTTIPAGRVDARGELLVFCDEAALGRAA